MSLGLISTLEATRMLLSMEKSGLLFLTLDKAIGTIIQLVKFKK
jgi:hypothetical protein